MSEPISKRNLAKASTAKPSGKPPPRDELLGLEPEIPFYELEDSDETEEGEQAEILVITAKASLQLSNTYINPLDRGIHIWLQYINLYIFVYIYTILTFDKVIHV